MLKPSKSSVRDVIRMQSSEADVVFFGLATPDEGEEETYAERLEELAGHFPVVFLVKNSSLFVGNLVKPEELEAPEEPEKIEADPD
jgi:hypothetical protein